jgi:predicted DNA binding protein
MNPKRMTVYDIAKVLGVSNPTASLALKKSFKHPVWAA